MPPSSGNWQSYPFLGDIPLFLVLGETYASPFLLPSLIEPAQSLGIEMGAFPQLVQPILNIIARSQNPAFQKQCGGLLRVSVIFPGHRLELTCTTVAAEE